MLGVVPQNGSLALLQIVIKEIEIVKREETIGD